MDSTLYKWWEYSGVFNFTTTSCVIIALTVVFTLHCITKQRGLPPGPIGLPYLGIAPFLKAKTCHLELENLKNQYGDVFSFKFAGTLYIHLGSMKAIRELYLNNNEFFQKTSDFSFSSYMYGDGVGFINGEPWRVLKKFSVQQFREVGMTAIKDNMNAPMNDSIRETIDYLREKKGQAVGIVQLLTDKSTVIMRRTLFGDIGITDQQIKEMNESYGHTMVFMAPPNILYSGNIARYFFLPLKPGYWNAVNHHKNMHRILRSVVNEHKKKLNKNEGGYHRNFIDAYILEKKLRHSKGDPTAEYFTDSALISSLSQFVGDGVLSLAAFVALVLKSVVEHEECQEKIYQEISEVVGSERVPTLEDKSKLIYTNSFISEVFRTLEFGTSFPSQQCISETTFRGYRIPKGAITLMNMYSCHHDSSVYEDPEKFDPTRFLPGNGKRKQEVPNIFGVGKRACIGEGFTMTQIYLFLVAIVQNFKLSFPKKYENMSLLDLLSGKMELCATPWNEVR